MGENIVGRPLTQLKVTVRMNCIYHEMCEALFSRISQVASFISILGGSASLVAIVKLDASGAASTAIIIISLIVTVVNTLLLSFRIPEKASIHRDLKRDYMKLWSDIILSNGQVSPQGFAEFEKRISFIEDHEPPCFRRFMARAESQAAITVGAREKVKVSVDHRPIKEWEDVDDSNVESKG